MSVTPGQAITRTQLDQLATLANTKLPIRYRINGLLVDGDPVQLPVIEAVRQQIVAYYPDASRPQKLYAFTDSNWRDELLRIRVNLANWIGDFGAVNGYRSGAEVMVSGKWPVFNAPNAIQVANINQFYTSLEFYSENAGVTFTLSVSYPDNSSASLTSLRQTASNCVRTGAVYLYTVGLPNLGGKRATVTASSLTGVWFVKRPMFAPNMNPFSAATPLRNYDERITRFAAGRHRALSPYAELPTPYPPADITYEQQGDLTGQTIPVSYSQFYDGLAEYFYGLQPDVRGPKSPSASSYFRVPCYPVRKRSDGAYTPFATESISGNGDFTAVIRGGMIYSLTISRATATESVDVDFGNIIDGAWFQIGSETLSADVRSKTIFPSWLVFGDAPIYYDSTATLHIQPTFIARQSLSDGLWYDVKWPVHSSYFNDTEAILNTLP